MAEKRVRPFHCGSQAADWIDRNCERCVKGHSEETGYNCPIQEEIDEAWFGDGTLSAEMGRRMGYDPGPTSPYTWDCPEWSREFVEPARADLPGQGRLFT